MHGPRVFNELPKHIRNFDGTLDTFKRKLDDYLSAVEDEPYDPTEPRSAPSNSLKDQITQARLVLRA